MSGMETVQISCMPTAQHGQRIRQRLKLKGLLSAELQLSLPACNFPFYRSNSTLRHVHALRKVFFAPGLLISVSG